MKTCKKCKSEFSGVRCLVCLHQLQQRWYLKHQQRISKKNMENKLQIKQYNRMRNQAIKLETFNAYGGAFCTCCGEHRIAFLTLDHIKNNGAEHRRELGDKGRGLNFYRWLQANDFPDLGLQVLCFNCNCGKRANGGICPHIEERNIKVSHSFEQSGPGDSIMNMHRPEGHAHLDQKLDKGMRSPMLAQLPVEAGLASPETSGQSGSGHGDSGYTGQGRV